jgi:S-adenosylmethionine hydrolase
MLLHLIADFGVGDLAFAEVTQHLHVHLPDAHVVATPVPPFQTLAAGFCVAQLALAPAPEGMVVFHNVAPRRDDTGVRRDQEGEALACARTPAGVTVVGVNAGYAFSFLRSAGVEVRAVRAAAGGSQFRSRDVFPEAVARVVAGDEAAWGPPLALERIPPVPQSRLAYVDGFGNLKTTVPAEALEPGTHVRVSVAGVAREARVAGGGFGVPEGSLAFAPGSSGWETPTGRVRWVELFLRGGSAWEAFERPPLGAELTMDVLSATA